MIMILKEVTYELGVRRRVLVCYGICYYDMIVEKRNPVVGS